MWKTIRRILRRERKKERKRVQVRNFLWVHIEPIFKLKISIDVLLKTILFAQVVFCSFVVKSICLPNFLQWNSNQGKTQPHTHMRVHEILLILKACSRPTCRIRSFNKYRFLFSLSFYCKPASKMCSIAKLAQKEWI